MTVEEAFKVILVDELLGNFVYSIRERSYQDGSAFQGSSWDHPRVKRFSEAVAVLEEYYKSVFNGTL